MKLSSFYRTIPLILMLSLALLTGRAGAFDFSRIDLNKIGDMVSKSTEAFGDIEEAEEIEIGTGVAARLLGAAPLLRNHDIQYYVNDVGMWLALRTDRASLPWHFGVIDSDAINAFATPGGYVFITRGLFESLRDEAELAGVLGHEISHVTRRHHLAAIQKNARLAIAKDVASMVAEREGYRVDMFINTGVELYTRGLDKDDEFDADRHGKLLAVRGGYHPDGLHGMLMTLANMHPLDNALALMFKTHPPALERLKRLEETEVEMFQEWETLPRLPERFARMQNRIDEVKD